MPANNSQSPSISVANKYKIHCDYFNESRIYRCCLLLVDAFDSGRLSLEKSDLTCANAMRSSACIAVRMRNEELAAGAAIYFTEEERAFAGNSFGVDKSGQSYKNGWSQVGKTVRKSSCDTKALGQGSSEGVSGEDE